MVAVTLIVLVVTVVGLTLVWLVKPSPLDELARARVEVRRHAWLQRERARLAMEAIDQAALAALREVRGRDGRDDTWRQAP